MPQPNTWVLVADGSRARLFRVEDHGRLVPALAEESVRPRRMSREIASERAGRQFDRVGGGHHAMAPEADPARHEEQAFAHAVVERLEAERVRHAFERLVVAAPEMLGNLRTNMAEPLARTIVHALPKDYSKDSAQELERRLGDLAPA